MRKPVENESFLHTMISLVKVIQIGTTFLLIILALTRNFSMITYNGYQVNPMVYLLVLVIQCICSLLLLRSLAKSVLRRKAWFIFIVSWALGEISIISSSGEASIHSSLTLFGTPLTVTIILLIIASHSYIKKIRAVWEK
jgi:hypothetical protein